LATSAGARVCVWEAASLIEFQQRLAGLRQPVSTWQSLMRV